MKKATKALITALAALQIIGCATPYCQKGFTGGYAETQFAPDVWRVTFRGNGYTSPERVQDFAMLRAAELTLQHGFTHLALINEQSGTSTSSFSTQGHADTTGTMNFYGNQASYSGHTTYTPGQIFTFYKPSTGLLFRCFKTPPEGIFTFDAAFLQQSLKQTYHLK